eukprot:m.30863 g.30863  ORF g.30863 m.30863 type:complete len:1739 (-) comp10649_c0_seq1:206-5422(-)
MESAYEDAKSALQRDVRETHQNVLRKGKPDYHLSQLTSITHIMNHLVQPIIDSGLASTLEEALDYLKSFNSPPVRCGHLFGNGEPTYTCGECGVDPTCVLCHACFMQSEHRNHQFSVHISHGGGCCDCGDQEAWRGHAFCQIHQPHGDEEPKAAEALVQLPELIQQRLFVTVNFVFETAQSVLIEREPVLPPCTPDFQCTTLYNDEVHTFDEVIAQLRKAVGAQPSLGRIWANYVDVEGRAIVKIDQMQPCIDAATVLTEIRLEGREENLTFVSTQEVITDVLTELSKLSKEVDAIRAIVCGVLCCMDLHDIRTQQVKDYEDTLLSHFLLTIVTFWKRARGAVRAIFFSSVMLELDYKAILAIEFARHYEEIIAQYSEDDNDGGLGNISVQIYTVPSLARLLVQEHGALSTMLQCLLQSLPLNPERTCICSKRGPSSDTVHIIYDMKYILRNDVGSVLHMLPDLIEVLQVMQYMDSFRRKTGEHVLRESASFRNAFQIASWVCKLLNQVLQPHSLPNADRLEAIRLLATCLDNEIASSPTKQSVLAHVDAKTGMRIPDIHVERAMVSFHFFVQRFLTRLMCSAEDDDMSFAQVFSQAACKNDVTSLLLAYLEPALQAQVLVAQFKANFWVRNGYSVLHQLSLYMSFSRDWFFEADLATLQIAAVSLGLSHTIQLLIDRFALRPWFDPEAELEEDREAFYKSSLVGMLTLILNLYQARLLPGVGDCSSDDIVRQHLLYGLAKGPQSFSHATQTLSKSQSVVASRIIKSVADVKETTDGTVYTLKDEMLEEANNKFHHLMEKQRSAEYGYLSGRMSKRWPGQKYFPATCPIAFRKPFHDLYGLPSHPMVVDIAITLIKQYIADATRKKIMSLDVIELLIHLFAMGLVHDEKHGLHAVAKAMSEHTQEDTTLATAFIQLKATPELADDIAAGIDWLLDAAYRTADEESRQCMVDLGVPKRATEPASSEADKKKKKKRAGMKRQKLMNKFSKMQTDFKAMLQDADEDEEGELDTSVEVRQSESMTVTPDSEDKAAHTVSCIHCQEEGDSQTESFVALGYFCHGAVLKPQAASPSLSSESSTSSVEQARPASAERTQQRATGDAQAESQEDQDRARQRSTTHFLRETHRLAHRYMRIFRSMLSPAEIQQPVSADDQEEPEDLAVTAMEGNSAGEVYFKSCGHTMHFRCFTGFFTHWARHVPLTVTFADFECPLCRAPCNVAVPYKQHELVMAPVEDGDRTLSEVLHAAEGVKNLHSASRSLPSHSRVQEIRILAGFADGSRISRARFPDARVDELNLLFYADSVLRTTGLDLPSTTNLLRTWQCFGQTLACLEIAQRFNAVDDVPVSRGAVLSARSFLDYAQAFTQHAAVPLPVTFSRLFTAADGVQTSLNLEPEYEPLRALVLMVASIGAISPETTLPPVATPEIPFGSCVIIALVWCILRELVLAVRFPENYDDAPRPDDHLNVAEAMVERVAEPLYALAGRISLDLDVIKAMSSLPLRVVARCIALCRQALVFQAALQVDGEDLSLPRDLESCLQSLELPSLPTIIHLACDQDEPWDSHVKQWAKSLHREDVVASTLETPRVCHSLVKIPETFNEVVIETCEKHCIDTGLPMKEPALCLLCGTYVCFHSPCCTRTVEIPGARRQDMGGCYLHAQSCGAGTCLFLLVKHGYVLILSHGKGALLPSPYVDEHGEPDPGLRRSCRLFLHHGKYELMQQQWRDHTLVPAFDPHQRDDPGRWIAM